MARYRGPKAKIARRYNSPIFSESIGKVLEKKNYPPGYHGRARKRRSQFALQLMEKQKAKYTYGLLEKSFYNLFKKAAKSKGDTGQGIWDRLEARLDNVVYRLGIASTRRQARQMTSHRHITVNGKVVNIPSYLLKPGDLISIVDKLKTIPFVIGNLSSHSFSRYSWLEWDVDSKIGKFVTFPERSEILEKINEQSIVELYSK